MTSAQGDAWVCLMYHDIAPAASPRGGSRAWFAVTPETFAQQLDLIREAGLAGCSVASALASGAPRVAITFDDGVRSDYEHAFPALAQRGMTATFFVVTGLVGTPGRVTWSELREMRAAGMSIQSHTRTHPFLSELPAARLQDELARSKAELDDALGQNTDQLAYPGGDAPRRSLRHLLVDAGYRVTATSRWGRNRADAAAVPRDIRRCTVSGAPPAEHFRRVLAGDPSIAWKRQVREGVLGSVRRLLGPSRYAALRKRALFGSSAPDDA